MNRSILLCLAGALAACGATEPDRCAVSPDAGYPSADYATNAAEELALRASLTQLNNALRAAELDAGVTVPRATMDMLWTQGTPSLATQTPSPFRELVPDIFTRFVAAQGRVWVPAEPPTGSGGIFGSGSSSYIYTERGVDLRQYLEKGLFGALFYAQAASRLSTTTTGAQVDRLLALYGANPGFTRNDGAAPDADALAARYAKRRTPTGQDGLYTRIRDGFITARALAGRPECSTEQAAALTQVMQDWEKVLASTVIFYVQDAATRLQNPSADAASRSAALHGLGEGVGFLAGLASAPVSGRRITDTQVSAALVALRMPSLADATAHRLLTDVPSPVEGVLSASTQLQAVYGFTAQEMTQFRTNY